MVCIYCTYVTTPVQNSRPQKRLNQVWRRRHCDACGATFTTIEVVDYDGAWQVTRHNGVIQPFHKQRLLLSIYQALRHRDTAVADAEAIVNTVLSKLLLDHQGGRVSVAQLRQTTLEILERFDDAAGVQYAAFHPESKTGSMRD